MSDHAQCQQALRAADGIIDGLTLELAKAYTTIAVLKDAGGELVATGTGLDDFRAARREWWNAVRTSQVNDKEFY